MPDLLAHAPELPVLGSPPPPDPRPDLAAMSRDELAAFVRGLGEPAFRGRQLFRWLHARGAASFDAMTDLPKGLRERLVQEARIGGLEEVARQTARDRTIKVLFRLPSGRLIESVLIPDFEPAQAGDGPGEPRRMTVCVSS